jgi:hypothetical protein
MNSMDQLMTEYDNLCEQYAEAKSHRVYLDEFRKSLHAILMKEAEVAGAKTVSAQDRDAYAHERYQEHLKVLRDCVEREEKSRYHLKRIEMEYEIWRTQQANERLMAR